MGDNHVCSLCDENLAGKQHVKIVFENWPHEKVTTYQRKGKEYHRKKLVTKELITALCMKCLADDERWAGVAELEEPELTPFFNYLAKLGKNPLFKAILVRRGPLCITADCPHRTAPECDHVSRSQSDYFGLDALSCAVGHPGETLARHKEDATTPKFSLKSLKWLRGMVSMSWKPEHGLMTKIYFTLTYTTPLIVGLLLYMVVAYPFWWMLKLKNWLSLEKAAFNLEKL